MIKFYISEWTEETECAECGCPLYIDDPAIEMDGRVYCSRECLESHAERINKDNGEQND